MAVLAAVLLPQLLDSQDQAARGQSPAPGSAGPTAQSAATPTSTPAPTATTSGTPTEAAPTTAAVPAGFTRYRDPGVGFQVAVPTGWRPVRRGTIVDFDDPGSGRFLRIDTYGEGTPYTPRADPYTNWISNERIFRQGKSDYENLGIKRVSYGADKGWTAADWEFRIGGTHVRNRNVLVDSRRAHAIYWSTPESMWNAAESKRIFDVAAATFVPAPVD